MVPLSLKETATGTVVTDPLVGGDGEGCGDCFFALAAARVTLGRFDGEPTTDGPPNPILAKLAFHSLSKLVIRL